MKKTVLLVAVLLIFSFGTSFAQDVWFDVKCPTAVKAGTTLNVTVDAYAGNQSCTGSVSVTRLMVAMGGNSGGTLGGVGLWGPYQRGVSWSIPACSQTPLTKTVNIISSVPASLADTMAMVLVSAIDSTGNELTGDDCLVKVNP